MKSCGRETRFTPRFYSTIFFLFAVFSRVTWERGTTRSAKEVRNVDCDSFIQTKNTPDSGNLQKVLITVSTRKIVIQDMISKVFDQPALDLAYKILYTSIIYVTFQDEGVCEATGISQLSFELFVIFQ